MKSKAEFNFLEKIDKTKITLIRHYMAEKGMESTEFDEQLAQEINAAVDTMYRKHVPKAVRDLFAQDGFVLKKAAAASSTTKEDKEEVSEEALNNE